MIIRKTSIENVKSFFEYGETSFDENLNILIGPNGGGKSNFLDILSLAIKSIFLLPYRKRISTTAEGRFEKITRASFEGDLSKLLERHYGKEMMPQRLSIEFEVTEHDCNILQLLKDEETRIVSHQIEPPILSDVKKFFKDLDPSLYSSGMKLEYPILPDGPYEQIKDDPVLYGFYKFLRLFEFFRIVCADAGISHFPAMLLFLGPYRSTDSATLNANLAKMGAGK